MSLRPKSRFAKKNALLCTIGPPTLKPACWSWNCPTFRSIGALANQIFVASEDVGRACDTVGSAARNGIHAAASESALPDVVGRDDQLQFLDGIEADWLRPGLPAWRPGRRKPEQVVVDRAVDLEVVVPVMRSAPPRGTSPRCSTASG